MEIIIIFKIKSKIHMIKTKMIIGQNNSTLETTYLKTNLDPFLMIQFKRNCIRIKYTIKNNNNKNTKKSRKSKRNF